MDRKGKYFYKHSIPLELCNEIINRVPVNDTGIHDGTWINPRDGTTIIRARDGTFLREKIPKPPDLNRPGEGKIYAVNNRKTGLNGNDMKKDRRRLPAGQAGKHEVGSPIEFKPSFGKERIEKMDTSSVVLCENSVNSVVKNELLK